jgi:hypothetical protein
MAVGRLGLTGIVIATVLSLTLAACADTDAGHGDPPVSVSDEGRPIGDEEEPEPAPLTREQLERYYVAQVSWRECAVEEGVALSEPPSLEEFKADGGTWWVGAELSDEDWNRMFAGEEPSRIDSLCGEPPFASDFRVGREALERLYAWQLKVVSCLEAEGFSLEGRAPPLEEFVRTGGTNWVPAREFHRRYGFPDLEDATWARVYTRCGNDNQDMWLQATDFEVDRAALKARYEENLALRDCLERAGLRVPAPPPLEEFIEELGENWSNADIWGAVYRDNDEKAVLDFVEGIDQACPGVS